MRISSLLAVLFLVLPLSADALVRPPLSASKCPKGQSSEAPAVSKMDLSRSTDQAAAQKFLQTAFYCPNACYNLNASLTLTYTGVTVVVNAKDMCASKDVLPEKQTPPRGCVKGQTEPQVTISTKDVYSSVMGFKISDQTINKSRCDENVIETSVSKFFDGLQKVESNAKGAEQQMQQALNELKSGSDPRPTEQTLPGKTDVASTPVPDNNPTTGGTQNLQDALQNKLNIPAEQAKALTQSDPDKIADLVRKLDAGDTAGAQQIAKGLGLNDDVMKSIASLSPDQSRKPDAVPEEQQRPENNQTQSTFDQPKQTTTGLPTQCGTDGLAGNIMLAESRCGQITSNPLSSVRGPYHFLCDTWVAYANSTGNGQYSNCAYRDDPQISTTVMNAKMDQFAQQYGSQCTASGLSLSSCQYAIHVFGEGGFKNLYNAYLSNPNDSSFSVCGSALSQKACSNNASIFSNGGTVAGIFGELDRRLGGNGTVITSMSTNGSPFTGFTGSGGSYVPSGSPFGGVNPLYYNSYTGQPVGNSYPTGGTMPSGTGGSPFSFLTNMFSKQPQPTQIPSAPVQISYPTPDSAPRVGQQAVVSIVAQPQNTYRGNYVVVSWSSVGTRPDTPCITTMVSKSGTTTIATSNEGSKIITATSTGILRFSIACTSLTGESLLRSTNVSVQ